MEARTWGGTVPRDCLDVLHQLQRIFHRFGGVRRFGITNGHSVDRFLFTCWDRNMIVEIFSNAFFHNFHSDIFMMEYDLAESLSLSKALEELLLPPTADIGFLLIEGSNMLSLFKEVDGSPVVRKDIELKHSEFMPGPSMVVAVSNVYVQPKNFTMLYDFLEQAKGDEIAEIAFGEKNCRVSLGRLHLQAEGLSFFVVGNLYLDVVVRNRLVSPRPVWSLNISLLRRLYEVVCLPESKPLMYFGDSRVVAALKTSNGVVVARAMYLNKGLHPSSAFGACEI